MDLDGLFFFLLLHILSIFFNHCLHSQNVNSATNPESRQEGRDSFSAAPPWIIATILLTALLVGIVGLYYFGEGYWERGKENNIIIFYA